MKFVYKDRQQDTGFQRGWNMIMNLYGQRQMQERTEQQQKQFDEKMKLAEQKWSEQQKVNALQLKQAGFELKMAEKKAKLWDEQQKNVEAYNKEVQQLREQGKLNSKTHLQLRNKYSGAIPSGADIKSMYTETPEQKRKLDLKAKMDLAKFESELKGMGPPTPFKAFYYDPRNYGKTPGEISKLWHEARKADQIEVARARYPTRQQVPDVPGLTFDRRTGEYYLPGPLPGGVPIHPDDFGLLWAGKYQMAADKSALREITKRNELVKSFAKRIEVNSPIVLELAEKVGNTNTRAINWPINQVWKRGIIGDGDLAAYKLALTSLSNEIAKVESSSLGISGVSVEQMQIMAEIHDPNLSLSAAKKVIDTGMRLSQTLEGALESQRADILTRISNWSIEDKEANETNKEFSIMKVKP